MIYLQELKLGNSRKKKEGNELGMFFKKIVHSTEELRKDWALAFDARILACVPGGFVGERARARIPRNFVRGMGR